MVLLTLLATAASAQTLAAYVPASGRPVHIQGLTPGASYQLRISGWMTFGTWSVNGRTLQNDACYEFAAKGYPDPLPVLTNDAGVIACGAYAPDHVYTSAPFQAQAASMRFWVLDSDYRDNQGALLVELLPVQGAGTAGRYCVLRNQDLYGPPVCFQFYLADTRRTSGAMAVLDAAGGCAVSELAARQGWEVDPTLGGPYATWEGGDQAMSTLSRYGGDLYGCLAALDAWDPWADDDPTQDDDPWANSCPWAFDGECDEPGIGTGLCDAGTDTADCAAGPFDPANSCYWAYDGECDEPGIGTGVCDAGTDTADCASVRPPPQQPDLPEDVEERDQELNQCEVWSASNSGGAEGTIDRWDVSTIPDGAVFDLRYDAESMPDRFHVDYLGARVWDSGWRGSSSYATDPDYPGGIAGPGAGERLDLFRKAGSDRLTVTVIGGESGTVWSYQVRCRMP
jgi:hypothetical protein